MRPTTRVRKSSQRGHASSRAFGRRAAAAMAASAAVAAAAAGTFTAALSWSLPLLRRSGPHCGLGWRHGLRPQRADCPVALKACAGDVATCAVGMVVDEWQAEAQRCWGLNADGQVVGRIAELVGAGGPERGPAIDRAWKRLPGNRTSQWKGPALHTHEDTVIYYYSGKSARDTPAVLERDYAMALRFLREEEESSGGTLLDLCCGDGFMARRFVQVECFDRVLAADVSRRQLEVARKAAEEERTGPDDGLLLARVDAQALPFGDGKIDAVWWGLGMHMVKDAEGALKEISRVLRPGGRLLATTRVESFIPSEIKRMAEEAGLADVSLKVPRFSIYAVRATKPL